jgi:hypothetical protein
LTLLNIGPAVTVGLPPYGLQRDINVSLGGGGLSVGAPLGQVSLVDPPLGRVSLMDSLDPLDSPDPPDVPEPGSGLLLLGGGALLWALARLRRSKLARGA